jgi:hypothetical protein
MNTYFAKKVLRCRQCLVKKEGRYVVNEGDPLHQAFYCDDCIEVKDLGERVVEEAYADER